MDPDGKWKAILIGGLITGLGPFIPVINLACCLFPLVGAIVAVAIYHGSQPPPALTNNDGVVLGALSGVAGAILHAILIIPLALFVGSAVGGFVSQIFPGLAEIPPGARSVLQGVFPSLRNVVGLLVLIRIFSHLSLSLVFGIIGGLIGVVLFTRK